MLFHKKTIKVLNFQHKKGSFPSFKSFLMDGLSLDHLIYNKNPINNKLIKHM